MRTMVFQTWLRPCNSESNSEKALAIVLQVGPGTPNMMIRLQVFMCEWQRFDKPGCEECQGDRKLRLRLRTHAKSCKACKACEALKPVRPVKPAKPAKPTRPAKPEKPKKHGFVSASGSRRHAVRSRTSANRRNKLSNADVQQQELGEIRHAGMRKQEPGFGAGVQSRNPVVLR